MLTRERIRELIDEHGLSDRADEIMAEVRPSIHLKLRYDVDEADIPVGASKMGGSPDVPEGFEFPKWNDNNLSFIAQIRLSDVKPFDLEDLLPDTGILYFFYEVGLYFDYISEPDYKPSSAPCRVIYLDDEAIPLQRMPHPISKFRLHGVHPAETLVFEACPIVFEQEWTPPVNRQDGQDGRTPFIQKDNSKRYWDWYQAVEEELSEPKYRLLGHETDIQYGYAMLQDARDAWEFGTVEDWILLFQVDSDAWQESNNKPGFMWGDMGLIYYCIDKGDLRVRRFDRIWLELISY